MRSLIRCKYIINVIYVTKEIGNNTQICIIKFKDYADKTI